MRSSTHGAVCVTLVLESGVARGTTRPSEGRAAAAAEAAEKQQQARDSVSSATATGGKRVTPKARGSKAATGGHDKVCGDISGQMQV